MADFKIGDRVSNSGCVATVVGVEQLLRVDWGEGILGFWPAASFELVQSRKFKEGDYVRSVADDDTNGTVGIIFEDDGEPEDEDPYWVGLFNAKGEELPFSANELVPWVPLIGERVIEADVEDDEEGTVVAILDSGKVRVLWDSFPLAQDWSLADLEPVDEFEDDDSDDDDFGVGDEVVFGHPMLSVAKNGRVIRLSDNVISVTFGDGSAGTYPKDFFSKAA